MATPQQQSDQGPWSTATSSEPESRSPVSSNQQPTNPTHQEVSQANLSLYSELSNTAPAPNSSSTSDAIDKCHDPVLHDPVHDVNKANPWGAWLQRHSLAPPQVIHL